MTDLAIGIGIITISIYGIRDYFYQKKIVPDNRVSKTNVSGIGFASILGLIIGIAFILRGLGLLDGGGF